MNLAGAQEASVGHGQEGDPGVRMSAATTGQPGGSSPGTEGHRHCGLSCSCPVTFQNDNQG